MKKILFIVFVFFICLPLTALAGTYFNEGSTVYVKESGANQNDTVLPSTSTASSTTTRLTDNNSSTSDTLNNNGSYYGYFGAKKIIDSVFVSSVSANQNLRLVLYDQYGQITYNQIISYSPSGITSNITPTLAHWFKLINTSGADRALTEIKFFETPDIYPPGVPTNVTGTNGNMNVTLNWTKPSDADLDGYYIFKDGVVLANLTDETLQTYTVTNVIPGQSNGYQISSYDDSPVKNESNKSNMIYLTATDTTPPTTPSNLNAFSLDRSVQLAWTASTDNHEVSGYYIYVNNNLIATDNESPYTVTGLNNGTSYNFSVRAFDPSGNIGVAISKSQTPLDNNPPNLTNPTVTNKTKTQVTINWLPSGSSDIDYYEVSRSESATVTTYDHTTLTSYQHTFTGLSSGVSYTFTVKAIDDDNNITTKTVTDTTLSTAPAVPEGLTITPLDNRLNLDWIDNTDDVYQYKIYAEGNNTSLFTVNDSEKLIDGLINNVEKCYQITALDVWGNESSKTNAVCGTPIDITPPFDVSNLTMINATEYGVTIQWNQSPSTDIELYKVYRNNLLQTFINDNGSTTYQYTSEFMIPNIVYEYRVNPVDDDDNELLTGNSMIALATVPIPPPKLTGLTATRQNNAIKFDWTDIKSSVTDVTAYRVYKKVGTSYNLIGSPSNNTFTYSTNDTINSDYVVTAVDLGSSESEYSNPVTSKPILAPATPTNLTILPLDNQLKLTWSGSGSDIASYKVYEQNNNTAIATVINDEYTVSGLLNAVEKCYQVSAIDILGNESNKTAAVCETPIDYMPPFDVSNVEIVTSNEYNAVIKWDKSPSTDIKEYKIYKNGVYQTTVPDNGSASYQYTTGNLTPGESVQYQINPVDDDNNELTTGTQGLINVMTTGTAPAAPTNLNATKQIGAINFTWNASSEADFDYYKIYKKVGGSYQFIATSNTNSYSLTTSDETPTDYAVTAVDDGGTESGFSSPVTSNALPSTPVTPPNPYEGFMSPINATDITDSSFSLLGALKWLILLGLVAWFAWIVTKKLIIASVKNNKQNLTEDKPKRRKRTKQEREQDKKQRDKIRAEKKRVSALQREVRKKVQKSVGYKIYK